MRWGTKKLAAVDEIVPHLVYIAQGVKIMGWEWWRGARAHAQAEPPSGWDDHAYSQGIPDRKSPKRPRHFVQFN